MADAAKTNTARTRDAAADPLIGQNLGESYVVRELVDQAQPAMDLAIYNHRIDHIRHRVHLLQLHDLPHVHQPDRRHSTIRVPAAGHEAGIPEFVKRPTDPKLPLQGAPPGLEPEVASIQNGQIVAERWQA